MSTGVMILILLILLVISAFLAACETAFSSINMVRLKSYKDRNVPGAKEALDIANDYEATLSTILIGNNFVNILLTALATTLFTLSFGAAGVVYSTIVMTIVILIAGELLPKSFAKKNSEKFACKSVKALLVLQKSLYPLVRLLVVFNRGINKLIKSENPDPSITEEELISIVESIEEEGVIEEEESQLIKSAINFDDITIESLYTARTDIIAIDVNASKKEVLKTVIEEAVSRIPVYDGDIDTIVGILYEKEYFREVVADKKTFSVKKIMIDPIYVPKKMPALKLLNIFKNKKEHLAIVVDEHGGTEGIVTLEDLLENLVGEIWDEYDDVPDFIERLDSNKFLVRADCNLDILFSNYLKMEHDSKHKKVGIWLYNMIEKIPEEGDLIEFKNLHIKVLEVSDNNIKKVMFIKKEK